MLKFSLVMTAAWLGISVCQASATLAYTVQQTDAGTKFVMVEGTFEFSDDLTQLRDLLIREHPSFIGFDSPGGNVAKAIELGRMIRSFGLMTFQVRKAECASACSLAFLGGTARSAEPGSIGVHKSSFSDPQGMHVDDAVSAVQQTTAEIIGYMSEMGVDPGLLQLSLSYDSNDIRYLSGSEMRRFRVTTQDTPVRVAEKAPDARPAVSAPQPGQAVKALPSLNVPIARDGIVRHPKGVAPLKATESVDAKTVSQFGNGTKVDILDGRGDWYRVSSGGRVGYLHYTWVRVAQFEEGEGDGRYVQVKSFSSLNEATAFAHRSSVPLAVHLAANGWFAVTLKDVYAAQEAKDVAGALKAHGVIAKDSIVTLGNTYVRKVCCD
ncbi:hypothetical protein BJF92_14400 [Rhizobium rhizosphaerae]|uniref:SH3b domain-containing protein n=1 Tax=Xaviernesmea rhizosphaerae TaxID=1672749 RepID=A0A1Q9ACU0_9HYPH|nr:hypothetical protein BJF92_14400 [Xaviernesmea rhizosphaerae]